MRTLFAITLVAVALVAGLSFSFFSASRDGIQATNEVVVKTAADVYRLRVAIADDESERARGLMWIKHLREDEGMLFIFGDEDLRTFWMKNTRVPLDMVFIAADGRIVSIQENAMPCKADPCTTYSSAGPAKYVLEVRGGVAGEKHINAGDVVVIGK